jgi:hypothetical protein
MQPEAPIFQEIYEDYLRQVAACDLSDKADILDVRVDGTNIHLSFFNQPFTITPEKVSDREGNRPYHAVSVILCKYLLLCPRFVNQAVDLVTYKDFKDALPYVLGFKNTAEKPISRHFSGKIDLLKEKCVMLGGTPHATDGSYQLAYRFQALPRVPIYLFFNDLDEDFPAECTLLFEKSASDYLDMECIAMVGMVLAEWLKKSRFEF